ncbi:prolyl oligopeptidase family serine peptidase [Galactobacter sp.]|uniref:prolyl oligopeptidase family serine peptidase n=1 Tax=Galactobacter sp. TaxID=2676125 RepID=UPI0025C275FB|nr:prolyl oligopeptidase family serine peptidase [Galactobacter sp.]
MRVSLTADPNDPTTTHDPAAAHPWLGEIRGERAAGWAAERSRETDAVLDSTEHEGLVRSLTSALDAPDRLTLVTKHGRLYTNFWQDAEHPRGIWRYTAWESYASGSPEWETLLDLDALAAAEGVEWVWHGSQWCPAPDGSQPTRVLVSLSPDGGDAVRVREFDVTSCEFVAGGFDLPTAKTNVDWVDADTLYVGTVTGADDETRSSYASTVRRLTRGAALEDAPVIFEVDREHMSAWTGHDSTPGFELDVAEDLIDFYRHRRYVDRSSSGGTQGHGWEEVDVPLDARVAYFRGRLIVWPMSEWTVNDSTFEPGCLLAADLDAWLDGDRSIERVWTPGPGESLTSMSATRSRFLLSVLRDVSSAVVVLDPEQDWAASELPVPSLSSASVWPVDDEDPDCAEDYWMTSSSFLTPATLYRGSLDSEGASGAVPVPDDATATPAGSGGTAVGPYVPPAVIASAPARFDASTHAVSQRFATSADGTRVPYFLVAPVGDPFDGRTPVIINAYGGFRSSLTPGYSAAVGLGWLGRRTAGGRAPAYVVANLRGGGEYGPQWHTSALRENRVRVYEDLAAVARDLTSTGLTTPALTGVMGRSNGGLLTGNALTRYPELFGGISCGVPLLDMLHYTQLSAGHSWIAEYGDPDDPSDAGFLRDISPLHRLVDHPHADYPPTLIWTTTSDDRVGPVQARMMAAAMVDLGVDDVWFHEDVTGGHAGSVDHEDTARMLLRSYTFLWLALTSPSVVTRGE